MLTLTPESHLGPSASTRAQQFSLLDVKWKDVRTKRKTPISPVCLELPEKNIHHL